VTETEFQVQDSVSVTQLLLNLFLSELPEVELARLRRTKSITFVVGFSDSKQGSMCDSCLRLLESTAITCSTWFLVIARPRMVFAIDSRNLRR